MSSSIVVLPADKGNSTVVLNQSDYIRKMTTLLQDEAMYKKVKRDPTKKVETELQSLLSDVFKFIPPEKKHLYFRLLCHNGSAPAIYGLPKVHKPDVPLRPIVDFTRSPLHALSGYLHQVIRPVVGRRTTYVKDSSHFVNKLKDVTIDDEDVLVSFDVKSMFTSVPVDFAVSSCKRLLENDASLPSRTPIEVVDLCRLLDFCLRNTYFVFRKQHYKQLFGTAMGASVSVVCANIVLERIEAEALGSFHPAPKLFLRYVDDCFCVIRRQDASHFLEHLNSFQPTIQFTKEKQQNEAIPFLDVLVQRTSNGLATCVYRKPTHTGRYLSFHSAHPVAHKRSVASSALFGRAFRLC
ncbi:uncharacterized protein LOC144128315 [Amblyomma americanum]